ncbi:MAG: ABC transporter substrate-binding protein [Candidatus Zixiibacteriota bacterium]
MAVDGQKGNGKQLLAQRISVTRRVSLLMLLALALVCPSLQAQSDSVRIVTLASDTVMSTSRVIQGIKGTLAKQHSALSWRHFVIPAGDQTGASIVDSIQSIKPEVIVTIGTATTTLAKAKFPNTPIVFAAVLYPDMSGFVKSLGKPGGNITGASLNIPLETQFSYFKKIVPHLKRVGVLYTQSTKRLIDEARVVTAGMGLTLVAIPVNENKDLPVALDSIMNSCQGFWSIADPELFNPKSTKFILMTTLRKGLPVMGFSRNVVESGALFALDFDFKAVGKQAGAIVDSILRGARPDAISVSTVDVIWFHYNEKTAKLIQIAMPEELVTVAKEVYR